MVVGALSEYLGNIVHFANFPCIELKFVVK